MTNLAALSFYSNRSCSVWYWFRYGTGQYFRVFNGVRLALKYGSGLIRILFLILVSILIIRLTYQMVTAGFM